jgi:hypothetical protein
LSKKKVTLEFQNQHSDYKRKLKKEIENLINAEESITDNLKMAHRFKEKGDLILQNGDKKNAITFYKQSLELINIICISGLPLARSDIWLDDPSMIFGMKCLADMLEAYFNLSDYSTVLSFSLETLRMAIILVMNLGPLNYDR